MNTPDDLPRLDGPTRPGISSATLSAAGIRLSNTPEPGSIEIPYYNLEGKRTGFSRWRLPRVRADGQKYHQPSETGTRAYIPPQFHSLPPGGDLVIVEGEFKALALIDAGLKAIGLPHFNTYIRDEENRHHLIDGISAAVAYTKPTRILFLGDRDTATNYEFARHAIFLSDALTPLPVVLPRIPYIGPGKGIDDCHAKLGAEFIPFWHGIVESAEQLDSKAGAGALAARLLDREAASIKNTQGIERDKINRRVVEMAAKCQKEPLARDTVTEFAKTVLGFSRSAFTEAIKTIHANADKSPKIPSGIELLSEPKPWASEVNGAVLLNAIVDILNRFLVLTSHAADALALFILATYAKDCFDVAPYVNLFSPEKRCGKTLTLRLLTLLCYRALMIGSCSEASVFRIIDAQQPCLMIDEVDTFFRDKPELRGILNVGNVRSDAVIIRAVEVKRDGATHHEVQPFSVFGPKVFSGIGRVASTLADRSIVIPMQRKRPDEKRERFRRRNFDPHEVRQQCRRWIDDHADGLRAANPGLPEELNDRAADVWEPMLAIAETAGEGWAERGRAAAIALSGESEQQSNGSTGTSLLSDIRTIFTSAGTDRLPSVDLCQKLAEMEERPWGEINRGKPVTPHRLAKLLAPYAVSSRKIRLTDNTTKQGYIVQDFADAWERYLSVSASAISDQNNGTSPINTDDLSQFQSGTDNPCSGFQSSTNPCHDAACSNVPLPGEPFADKHEAEGEEIIM